MTILRKVQRLLYAEGATRRLMQIAGNLSGLCTGRKVSREIFALFYLQSKTILGG